MNWEMFFAAITWLLTFAAGFTGIVSSAGIPDNHAPKKLMIIAIVAIIVFILCIAIINGMGWYSE